MKRKSDSLKREHTTRLRTWLCEPMPADVKKSIRRLAAAPDVQRIAVMPDVHLAEGVCVGNVVATSRLLYPPAVGGDIGCGMAALAFDAEAAILRDGRVAGRVLDELRSAVPPMRHASLNGSPALPPGLDSDHDAALRLSDSSLVSAARREGRVELGTLGRGNHFLEFQSDDDGRLWLMLHSGSRHMGQAITALHLQRATPTIGGLRFLECDSDEGQAYLRDVEWACAYADANRRVMLDAACSMLAHQLGIHVIADSLQICNHNHVRSEAVGEQTFWVHRKGAISAAAGELGIVPGSMGTSSYHVRGRGCEDALRSSSHGAGRQMSRVEARRAIGRQQFARDLGDVRFDKRLRDALREEAPSAYKDIDAVMRAQRDLTRIIRRLRPVLVYKGV